MKIFEPVGLILVVVAVLILFGPKRLPDLGRSFGKTMKAFREGAKGDETDEAEKSEDAKPTKSKAGTKSS